ncbi:MAG: hypothetical protein L0331_06225, partial [Chloroflexi bacterium]|nr:hypothetical protein [Chloroflexota bacterium]
AGGAEALPPRRFMTVMDALVHGVAFAPSDEELAAFLAARPAAIYPAPEWLEDREQGTGNRGQGVAGRPGVVDETAERIRALLAQNRSLRAVQREVFGYTGGAAYEAVKTVQAQMRASGELDGNGGETNDR